MLLDTDIYVYSLYIYVDILYMYMQPALVLHNKKLHTKVAIKNVAPKNC